LLLSFLSEFLDTVTEDISFKSHRPDWIDELTVPRQRLRDVPPVLRRFNGRRTQPGWVYDNSRYAFEDKSWPYGLVGRIVNNRGFNGTAALIADRVVITASHMVPWGDSPWWIRFVPAYFNGTSLYGAGVESYVSDARSYAANTTVTGYDWAILRLYEPLGYSLGYFGYNSYLEAWNNLSVWSNIGYPGDIDNAENQHFRPGLPSMTQMAIKVVARSLRVRIVISIMAILVDQFTHGGTMERTHA
jgi:hypothetical protein